MNLNGIAYKSLLWIPDDQWFTDRKSCKKLNQGNERARVFDIQSGKRCYSLPTSRSQDYLIRGSFPADETDGAQLDSLFSVSIGVTPLGLVNSLEDLVVEGIFRAVDSYSDFCLVHEKGDPYVSSLELRPLNDSNYLKDISSSILKLVNRTDLGGIGETRYPEDRYDRIWKPASSLYSPTNSTVNIEINVNTTVPLKVLQTAVTDSNLLEFLQDGLDDGIYSNYTVILYFLELNDTVTRIGQRVFDIYLNNERKEQNFDIVANGSKYREVVFIVTAKGSLNLTLVKVSNGSEFGPICNAFEILQVQPWNELADYNDVIVIRKVKEELLKLNQENALLETWSGDPCLPVHWQGLTCNSINGSTIITDLDLSSSKFQGPLPPSITSITHLKTLNLSNNDFRGEIPTFPPSSTLTSLDISNNELDGSLAKSLISLPDLRTLYYGCNPGLENYLPSSFNSSKLATDSGACSRKSKGPTKGIAIGAAACGSAVVTLALGTIIVCLYRRKLMARRKYNGKGLTMAKNVVFSIPSTDDFVRSISIQTYTLQYIEIATQKYKTLIGEGGFGSVYRGTLPDGQEVAVKVRSATSTQGTREFENELNLLSAIRHENLVPLLGYCCENDQQILVYPFMSNGSLQDRLYGEAAKRKFLDWPTRLSVALGAARGLMYLHTYAGRSVIHRDVKSSNILLDNSMCAKVADFGFSKYAPQEGDSNASLEVRGTAGYMDPEYYSTQHLSAKSDVFSFGVVLLEIISGREPLNIHRPRNEWSLVEWAKSYIRESKIEEIIDPNIKGGYHAEAMWRVVEVALACIEPFSAYRPCMSDIVRELEDALIIENNASEYMKSIDSMYSLGGSNRISIVMEKRIVLAPTPTASEPSPINTQALTPPNPR
ncbi:hypothetical protein DITRI_Ditri16bG0053100 [Diplodiscus trichospermus]